ncbi:hypothetical protein, partial [Fulvivirga lutimaris]|uniref:hypothetical protein n=1 Tax=Fulvivirga lutimaris TaxID=1819566 RepID=UPI0016267E58
WESPLTPFKGAVPITFEQASNRVHLQIDFDKLNRPVVVHVKIGKHYKDFEGRFGNLYINAPKTVISYDDKVERHHFFDRFGNQISVMGDVYEKVYSKDEYGRNLNLEFIDSQRLQTKDMFGTKVYHWTYLDDGRVIEERRDENDSLLPLRGGFQFLRTRITFGPDGYPAILDNIDEEGNLAASESGAARLKYYYDSQGRFLKWEVYDTENNPAIGPSNTAGEVNSFNGYELDEITFYNKEKEPALHWSGAEKWKFDKDQYGNFTRLTFLTAAGRPMTGIGGYSTTVYQWSDDGRFLLSQFYLDANGDKIANPNSNVHKVVHQRNNNGTIKESRYYTTNDQLVGRKRDNVAVIRYLYDDNGVKIGVEYLDVNQNVVKK